MSEDKGSTPEATPPAESGESVAGSIGLSEGYRGINVVNAVPLTGVPEPGGLPATSVDTAPSAVHVSPADSAPPAPPPTQE